MHLASSYPTKAITNSPSGSLISVTAFPFSVHGWNVGTDLPHTPWYPLSANMDHYAYKNAYIRPSSLYRKSRASSLTPLCRVIWFVKIFCDAMQIQGTSKYSQCPIYWEELKLSIMSVKFMLPSELQPYFCQVSTWTVFVLETPAYCIPCNLKIIKHSFLQTTRPQCSFILLQVPQICCTYTLRLYV